MTEQVVVVAGGDVAGESADLVRSLTDDRPATDLLVVHERDPEGRWKERPRTFTVRDRPMARRLSGAGHAAAAARATDLELRAWLWRRRRRDVVLVGRDALRAAPFLARHRGRRVAVLTVEDDATLRGGATVPDPAAGGPHRIVPWDELLLVRGLAVRDDPRWQPAPGWTPTRSGAAPTNTIVAIGPPDRAHGIDLAGRVLRGRAEALRTSGASLRWLAPAGSGIDPEDAAEFDRLGVADLVEVVPIEPGRSPILTAGSGAVALLAIGRPGATTPPIEALRAHREGLRTVAHDIESPPMPGVATTWDRAVFGDTATLAAALVRAVHARPKRQRPGPVGVAGLLDGVTR